MDTESMDTENMDTESIREQKLEALQAVSEYLQKLIPGMETLCKELREERKPDTDDFQKQCIDGLNWVIEIYNRISDVLNMDNTNFDKGSINAGISELGNAIKDKNDIKIADALEQKVIPFLYILVDATKK